MNITNLKDTMVTNSKEFENKNFHSNLKFIVGVLVVSFIFVQIITYFFGIIKISGDSMLPTYKSGEFHIYSTDTSNITYGDVILFKNEKTKGALFIKRVVALPGDTFSCMGTSYKLNNHELHETYINDNISKNYSFETTIPTNCIFVCGDNRDESYDSRDIGAINIDDVIGVITY